MTQIQPEQLCGLHVSDSAHPREWFLEGDIHAAVARVRGRGGEAAVPEATDSGLSADCRDDQGTQFGLWQPSSGLLPEGEKRLMNREPLTELRRICLALPEVAERLTWEETPTFRVRDKIFAMYSTDHRDGRVSMWCKAPPGAQEALVGSDPERFFVPPYVGHNGWIGVRFEGAVDWDEVTELVTESYEMTAPKKLRALIAHPQSA